MQVTTCESCGGAADEMDHRLAINVARALGPAAPKRAFTRENLHWLSHECHTAQDAIRPSPGPLSEGLPRCAQASESNREWASVFPGPFGLDQDAMSVAMSGLMGAA